ncbi:MAG TPA: 5'-nucleotidase domain-containing protein, partial [Myxococcaceae bacterium]|nr:5'-nucleotidase domain-containing protein [Myxococcaceae bacterium]
MRSIVPPGGPPAADITPESPGKTETLAELRNRAADSEARAQSLLADPDLSRLLATPREKREIERARQIFVNRNLRMSKIEVVGFDMDYT